jgi:glycosyltransferase involved in cell wall biosynthesis
MGENMKPGLHFRSPEVSVLMSCYNAGRWLHEAIDSVLAQTFENFEFILVDDGSTDETWNIIQSYRARDERIVAISKKNTGLPDSLNVGIAKARGAWIARLDADDLCEPTRLEEQASFVHKHPEVVLLGTGCVEIDEQGRVKKKHIYPSGHRRLVRHLVRLQRFFPHSSAFYRADVVKQVGGYNIRFSNTDDLWLWLELLLRGKIACLPKSLVRIRTHSGQISNENSGRRQVRDGRAVIACHFLRKAGCGDPSVDASANEWIGFVNWVEKKVEESGTFERRKAWIEARVEYFGGESKLTGALRFGIGLLQSGHASLLVWEKLFGSSMPKRLAREWMKRSCAVS